MYLTAQEVRPPNGPPGVNAFLNLHRELPMAVDARGEPDVFYISQFAGGYPVAEAVGVAPGGNTVTAYVDLAAADAASADDLRAAIAAVRGRIGTEVTPIEALVHGVSARFNAVVGMDGRVEDLRALLDRLEAAALALLPHRSDPPRDVSGPYVVWAAAGAEGVRLWLPPITLQRVPQSPARRAHVLVPTDVVRATPFDALGETAVALLGVNDADLAREGGVEIVDPQAKKTLLRYRRGSAA